MKNGPLEHINRYRAKSAQRPLDPENPRWQVEPWTLFDIEHYALQLGWKPTAGYRLARDPRLVIDDPVEWWREFFTRYYRPYEQGRGTIAIAERFGSGVNAFDVATGDMLRNADFEVGPIAVSWPENSKSSALDYRFCAIDAVRYIELYGPISGSLWPLNEDSKSQMIDTLARMMASVLIPRNLDAMPAR